MPEVAEEQLAAARAAAAHGTGHDRYDPLSPGREELGVDALRRLAARIGSAAAAAEILVNRDSLDREPVLVAVERR